MPSLLPWTVRTFTLLGAVALAAGCTSSVNLAARRGAYDAYLDLPAQGQASLQEKNAFYDDLLRHTVKPKASPYPAMKADLAVMQRNVDAIASRRQAIKDFEATYDQFAATHAEVRSDQPAEWNQYLALDGQFQPLGQSMQVSLQAFNAALADFNGQAAAHGIASLDAAELRAEVDSFREQMDGSLNAAEAQAREDRQGLSLAYNAGGDPKILKAKGQVLDKLDRELLVAEELQRRARANTDALLQTVPASGTYWTGPGMPTDGRHLAQLRADEAAFAKHQSALAELNERFNTVVPPPERHDGEAHGDHHDDLHNK